MVALLDLNDWAQGIFPGFRHCREKQELTCDYCGITHKYRTKLKEAGVRIFVYRHQHVSTKLLAGVTGYLYRFAPLWLRLKLSERFEAEIIKNI